MKSKEKQDKRRAALISFLIHSAVLLLFSFFGLTYMEPKPEEGIAVNFGYEEAAAGAEYIEGEDSPTPQPETNPSEASSQDPEMEEVVTQETVDAVAVDDKKPHTETTTIDKKESETPRKVDSRLEQALTKPSNPGGSSEGNATEGSGDQGDPTGDPKAPHGTGGGNGNSGNYRLGNRKPLSTPSPEYDCSEEGRVVVKIFVDRKGEVTYAEPGVNIPDGPKSSTLSSCLLSRAKAAAMKTRWQADSEAIEKQIGYIIYNFEKR